MDLLIDPKDYRPVYDPGVIEWLQNDQWNRPPVHVDKFYCLMLPSARILASLFSPRPKIVMLEETTQAAGSPFAFNHPVPWLDFGTPEEPRLRNAGQLSTYWGMAGVRFEDAIQWARKDVTDDVQA